MSLIISLFKKWVCDLLIEDVLIYLIIYNFIIKKLYNFNTKITSFLA